MNIRFNFFSLMLGVTLTPNIALGAPVESMSLEVFNDGATRFWEVLVTCESVSQPRSMVRPVNEEQWCSSEVKNLCDKNKFSLSRRLCDDNFSNQVASIQSRKEQAPTQNEQSVPVKEADTREKAEVAPKELVKSSKSTSESNVTEQVANRESLRKEQMQIEEQRILIQQKRLELRRRELSLQKRQLNAS